MPESVAVGWQRRGMGCRDLQAYKDRLLNLAVGGTTAYEYGYAFDGGRRWKKACPERSRGNLAGGVWTWFPCGVACSAGDLVEQTSDLTGQSWSTSALYLRGMGCGSSIYRRNSEWHLFDDSGTAGVITDGSANVLSNNLYDAFGVLMYASGSAVTQWRFEGRFVEEEGLVAAAGGGGDVLVGRGVGIASLRPGAVAFGADGTSPYWSCVHDCVERYIRQQPVWLRRICIGACVGCGLSTWTVVGLIVACVPCFACVGIDTRLLFDCLASCRRPAGGA